MAKKKSIWAFVLAFCLAIPAIIMMTACGGEKELKISNDSGFIAEGEFAKNTLLVSSKFEKTTSEYTQAMDKVTDQNFNEEKVSVFDISLENSQGEKVVPQGKVKITMPKPFESQLNYITFHIKDDGSVEALTTTTSDSNISFETTSFSYFVVAEKTPEITYVNSHVDSLEHEYNGAAVFVSRNDIYFDETPLRDITDEDVLGRIAYSWKHKDGSPVTYGQDITMQGTSYQYGIDKRIVGDEFAGPCEVGEYKFTFYYNGSIIFTKEAKITESDFKKISSIEEFDASTADTIFAELNYYTIVGVAEGNMYVMQMPEDSAETTESNVDAKARLVTLEDGGITLGEELDFVFTPMRYYQNEWRYFPENERTRENLLMDFCTGYYGARLVKSKFTNYDIYRTGWTKLSGDRIVRERGENVGWSYGNLVKFADDGAVNIYAPRKGETVNNALRLVKNVNGEYVFTGKDVTTDTRESYPVYIYQKYTKQEPVRQYQFVGSPLTKTYDNEPIRINLYKDIIIIDSRDDIGSFLKDGTIRILFLNQSGEVAITVDSMESLEYGENIVGPSAKGGYKFVLQEKDKTGTWEDKLTLEFEIK